MRRILLLLQQMLRDVRDGADARQGITMIATDIGMTKHPHSQDVSSQLKHLAGLDLDRFKLDAEGNLLWAIQQLTEETIAAPPQESALAEILTAMSQSE